MILDVKMDRLILMDGWTICFMKVKKKVASLSLTYTKTGGGRFWVKINFLSSAKVRVWI